MHFSTYNVIHYHRKNKVASNEMECFVIDQKITSLGDESLMAYDQLEQM